MNLKIHHFLILIVGILIPSYLHAQNITVSGKVTDEQNQPLSGVTITEIAGTHTTQTDQNGAFSLQISSAEAKLRITFVGYESQTQTVKSGQQLAISLKSENTQLTEVVVTALGISRGKKHWGMRYRKSNLRNCKPVQQMH
ncbi:hypothetical protein HMPREF0765_2331 [Sphingobacterium spiritivorum ATCC 33300]|uniref:TonB-dependent receptor plug domain-containing protein n=1 Tax=Sphingobacterium spiritivorum ATCC 33300 TaxID=525372 RepID=C2FYC5_SPHSI|nr:carboxypeptidase-like regulatory domain-containing protein [Sphingobacterium spiritivorum]EEI92178.1 hypothetical protein HMPREF0765_2331 [Sphingobacterium spiritivorum ATCC 33300]